MKISMNYLLTLFVVLAIASCQPEAENEMVNTIQDVIPKPVSLKSGEDFFLLAEGTQIILSESSIEPIGKILSQEIQQATGLTMPLAVSKTENTKAVVLTLGGANPELGSEGYNLVVSKDKIKLTANTQQGLFYGVQTLLQLLPNTVDGAKQRAETFKIECGDITDYPRFKWRGSMLDVARHFFSVEDVKRYIDMIASYKMNVLHLHLTDDQGWRIEIKSWPNLTVHGGSTQVGGGKGGYYTQEQYKDIVNYAQARFITIIPEIDLPSHINAALASYGELNSGIVVPQEGSTANSKGVDLSFDKKDIPTDLYTGIEVGWSTLRWEKPQTRKFIEDVLGELASITPGPYLHIGGDEAHVTKKEDYIRFVNFFREVVKKNGKKMIGWEEIAQSDINSEDVAQHWANLKYAEQALDKGAMLIMSPAKKCYLDMKYDSSTKLGLKWAGFIEVDDAYNWDPATELNQNGDNQIMGIEVPLWSETLTNMDEIEFMLFPRLPGLAEIGWTPAGQRNWDEYKTRLAHHAKKMKSRGINFYKSPRVAWPE